MVIDVNGNRLDAKFLRETGAIDDHFTLLKGGPAEPFRVVVFKVSDDQVIVRWKSIAGHAYQVEQSATLDGADWYAASDTIIATGATTSWTNSPPASPSTFYRVSEQ
jgi:hypothetical protein